MAIKVSQILSVSLLTVSALVSAGQAQAAQMYATDVVYYDNNNSVGTARSDINNALGADSYNNGGYFMSLGLGGRAVFDFDRDFAGEISLWEATGSYAPGSLEKSGYKVQTQYDESVDIYYGNFETIADWKSTAEDLDQWAYAGNISNITDGAHLLSGATNAGDAAEGVFNYVMLVDRSEQVSNENRDGFDVRAIAVNPAESVPEPTSAFGLLMLGSVGIGRLLTRKNNG